MANVLYDFLLGATHYGRSSPETVRLCDFSTNPITESWTGLGNDIQKR